jgi:hypothetical protein
MGRTLALRWGSVFWLAAASAVAQDAPDAGAVRQIPSGSTVDPGVRAPILKTLSPEQRLPENLRGWLRERRPRVSAGAEAKAPPIEIPAPSPAEAPEEPRAGEPRRPLRSFERGGITVLSNRELARENTPPAPAPRPSPQPVAHPPSPALEAQDSDDTPVDPPEITETHSLRAFDAAAAARHASESSSPLWAALAALTGGIGLAALWLRRRKDS